MLGIAIVDLKWTEAEFWGSTPYAFHAACEIAEERSKQGQQRRREQEFAARAAAIRRGMKERNG